MRSGFVALCAASAVVAVLRPVSPAAAETLTVCLEQDTPPYSYKEDDKTGGFDLAVAKEVAKRMGRELAVQWFEVGETPEEDKPPQGRAVNALLNAGKCQLEGSFPLIANDLEPATDKSRLPDFEGETKADRGREVPIGRMLPSKPYFYLPFTVLVGPNAANKKIATLADLEGLKIGSEDATLADAILLWYDHRRYMRQVVHFTPGKSIEHGGGLLDHLDRGDIDATLVELRRYDVYRKAHPGTKIVPTGFYYRIGFNMGFVGLPKDAALMAQVNKALEDMIAAKNILPALAQAEVMTYVAPHGPDVRGGVSVGDSITGEE
jgi:ABC-type amino acid transport substrate-binding protein